MATAGARRGKPADKTPFLSPEARRALLRGLRRAAGAVVVLVALAILAALLTYAPDDPSLNTAGPEHAVHNALGTGGAILADALVQAVGLAALAPVLVLLAWGWRQVFGGKVGWVWLRLLAAIAAVLLLATGFAAFGRPGFWPAPTGLGGFAGTLLLGHGVAALESLGAATGPWPLALLGGVLGLGAFLWASALRWSEVRATASGAAAVQRAGAEGAHRLGRAVDRFSMPSLPTLPRLGRATPDAEAAEPPEAPPVRGERREPVLGGGQPATPPPAEPMRAEPRVPVVAPPPPRPLSKREIAARQGSLLPEPETGEFRLPPLELLALPKGPSGHLDSEALQQNARLLEGVLSDFGVNGEIVQVRPGPVVTLYELEPAPGTKTSRVVGLADDIARSMSAVSVRIAVVPGKSTIGIELPNAKREMVAFRELLAADEFHKHHGGLILALGRDIGGAPVYTDLSRMPHLLIAGTTGSGKSVAVNTMICSLLYRLKPEDCRFIMIDPKMLELSVYDGIPHLLTPVVTDPGKAVVALKWAVKEMENRYRAMSQMGVRNIAGYNQKLRDAAAKGQQLTRTVQTGFDPETGKPEFEEQQLDMTPLPYVVVIVDEMADLMLVAGKDVEAAIQRLAQMARAAGIHLIMATQRPSVDVITGTIKANFPTRISFQVTSKIDSRTILGEQGAEQLLGQGDMLHMAAGGRITRVHGPFIADDEVEQVVAHLRAQAEPDYVDSVIDEEEQGGSTVLDAMLGGDGGAGGGDGGSGDALFDQAIALVARERKASTSFVQRHLQIGYNRAARLIERMEKEGMVSKANHVGKREVLLPPPQDDF